MNLVQELRAQLERVVRNPNEYLRPQYMSRDADVILCHEAERLDFSAGWDNCCFSQPRRIAILAAAIRAAVVTRETQS